MAEQTDDFGDEVARSLSMALGKATGRYPEWGQSPQSRTAQEAHGRRFAVPFLGRGALLLRLAAVAAVAASGAALVFNAVGSPTPAGGGAVNIWAVAALSETNLVAVGGTDDASGSLVEATSTDAGATWSISRPGGPALTTVAAAGKRLVAATDCAAQPSGSGPQDGLSAQSSCLYESSDGGRTWQDLHAGAIVGPSFADDSHGFAHSPLDMAAGTASRLYTTSDGGRTWSQTPSPCGAAIPWISETVAISVGRVGVLCVANVDAKGFQPWQVVALTPGSPGSVLAQPAAGGIPAAAGVFRFAVRPDGAALLFGDQVFKTTDSGTTWSLATAASARIQGGCFTANGVGYFAVRDSGRFTGIATTTDGGSTWRDLIQWPFFGQ